MWSFLARLRERKLAHLAIAYLAGAWLLLQVLGLLAQPFAWPALVLKAATVLLGIGFFGVLVLAWYHGEKGVQRVSGVELGMLIGILVIAGAAVSWVGRETDAADAAEATLSLPNSPDSRRVLVLPFDNDTGAESWDNLGSIVSDWITEALLRTGFVDAVIGAPATAENATGRPESLASLAAATRAGTLIVGRYYLQGDELVLTARLVRSDGTVLEALPPVRAPATYPDVGIGAVGERVLSALALHHDSRLTNFEAGGIAPPFAAYQSYVEGVAAYLNDDYAKAAGAFDRALQLDSTFIRAGIWSMAANWFDGGAAKRAEVLVERHVDVLTAYDLHHFRFFQAVTAGDHELAYREAREMMNAAPASYDAIREAALSAYRARRPREALALWEGLDVEHGALATWTDYHLYWYRTKATLQAGDTPGALRIAREAGRRYPGTPVMHKSRALAYAAAGKAIAAAGEIDALLNLGLLKGGSELSEYVFTVSDVAFALGKHGDGASRRVLERGRTWLEELDTTYSAFGLAGCLAEVHYLLGDTARARLLAGTMPKRTTPMGRAMALTVLGALAARGGDTTRALEIAREIESVPFLGWESVLAARIHALLGDAGRAAAGVSRAVSPEDGAAYDLHPDFDAVRRTVVFMKAVQPK